MEQHNYEDNLKKAERERMIRIVFWIANEVYGTRSYSLADAEQLLKEAENAVP